jgi:hypothetical protein
MNLVPLSVKKYQKLGKSEKIRFFGDFASRTTVFLASQCLAQGIGFASIRSVTTYLNGRVAVFSSSTSTENLLVYSSAESNSCVSRDRRTLKSNYSDASHIKPAR